MLTLSLAACGDDSGGPDTEGAAATTQDPSTSGSSTGAVATTQDLSSSEGSGSTSLEPTTGGVAGLSFAADVYGVLDPPKGCDCHTGGSGGLKMGDVDAAYAGLVGVMSTESPLKRVEPGSAEASYLWHKVSATHLDVGGSGKAMPLGAPPLAQETLDLLKEWIDGGAQP